jgi:glycerol-3-phosphate O-acyltransferase/dihydroxyacetone phosphate acyltransferase
MPSSNAGTAKAAAPQAKSNPTPRKDLYPMAGGKYDVFLWVIGIIIDLFFREVHPRGSWKVPKTGPILFVAAPHANQV